MTADACPGAGRCHVASWCAECDCGQHGPCDARARGERCDRHPASAVTRPQLEQARHELACADEDLGEAERLARIAEREAGRLLEAVREDVGREPADIVTCTGKSPRGDWLHATVWRGRELLHDPHPSRAGLEGEPVDIIVLVPLA